MSGKSKNRKQFFTLIELLVVIAIIAVLAGILMPALASARARSRAVKCQSNMSQLAMVFNYYGDDSGGYLPCLDNIGGAGAINSKGETVDAKSWLNDTVKRYLGKVDASKQPVELLRCPDEESLVDITTNYGLNYLVATRGVGQGIKRETHLRPGATAMIVENSGHLCYYPGVTNPGNLHNTGSSYGKNRAAYFRHAERAVTAFIDGHVELREKMSVPCLESFPEATAQMVENTVFNKGKADGSQPGISGM
ncbi:MAG: type II secretion system protein [Lentisphaeria bacterium]|nr:type II secretion system protein [Lentisphaeria bacterium]